MKRMHNNVCVCVREWVWLLPFNLLVSVGQLLSPFPAAYIHEELARYPHVKGKHLCTVQL